MLTLEKVSRNFGGLQALHEVDMVVPQGRITGLIGPNGAGKTTLINNMSGLDHPTSGTITFRGKAIERRAPHRIARLGIARTYQNIRLFGEMTPLQNLMVAQHSLGRSSLVETVVFSPTWWREDRRLRDRAWRMLERFHLDSVAHIPAGTLSYGDQRRLELARALATAPKLLLLDEPTAGMNPQETHTLGEQIKALLHDDEFPEFAVLAIEHDMAFIHQICDEVYVLNFGQIIAQGTPESLKDNPLVVEAYLGKE